MCLSFRLVALPPMHMEPDRGVLEDNFPFTGPFPLSDFMWIGGRVLVSTETDHEAGSRPGGACGR